MMIVYTLQAFKICIHRVQVSLFVTFQRPRIMKDSLILLKKERGKLLITTQEDKLIFGFCYTF